MTPEQLQNIESRKIALDENRLATEQAEVEVVDISAARSQAIKWTFTIASISTALGVLGLIEVPDSLPNLTTAGKWALAAMMAITLISAAVSIAFAGTGAADLAPGATGLADRLTQSRTNIKDALTVSRYAALIAFAAVSVGIGIVYLAPTEPPRYFLPQVDATTGQTSTLCGVLSVNEKTGAIELKPETDSAIAAVPVPDPTKLEKRDDGCH